MEFLTKSQTDNPAMPFLSDLLGSILRRLMEFFILAEIIKAAATGYTDKNICLPETATKTFPSSEGISASEKSHF